MNSLTIEKILEKYFNGETSLSEERRLREFFRQEEIPAHLAELKEQFLLFDEESREELPGNFDETLFNEINIRERSSRISKRTYIYYISGVAATILILITIFVRFDPFTSSTNNSINDPVIAFEEASKILYFVSDKFNQGANPLKKVTRFEDGVNSLNSITKFDEGVNKATPVSRFSQITKLITNPAP